MKIGEVAGEVGVNIQTLRYYERRALIEAPRRTESGYRDYDAQTVERVRFIKRSQALGFSLEEIRQLLDIRPEGTCGDLKGLVVQKVAEIDAKIAALQQMRQLILERGAQCGPSLESTCGFLAGQALPA